MSLPAPGFAFLDGALDRADQWRGDADAIAAAWPTARVLLVDADGNAGADDAGVACALRGADCGVDATQALFLGRAGDEAWFALRAADVDIACPRRVDLRSAAASWPAAEATAFAQARAVLHWRARHRHCGVCGAVLVFERAGWLGRCPGCGLEHYPRTDPAVIVAVGDGARLLLGRQAGWPERRYSTLAGFVEPGESLEQTVAREVFEESGVRVRASHYLASQPWPFPSSLMLGFLADAEPDEPVFGSELEDARWFTFDEVDAAIRGVDGEHRLVLSPPVSISRWLVEAWHARMRDGR